MSDVKIEFDSLPESQDFKTVNKAGIHLKFHLEEVEFSEAKEKDGKEISESFKVTLKGDTEQFSIYKFAPPTEPDKVKFLSSHYVNGKEVRKKTPEEQIQADFHSLYFFYEQLGKAMGGTMEHINKFKAAIKGADADKLFKLMFDKFFTIFPVEKLKSKKFNFKALWNNNDKALTSFLQIAKASATNVVFAPYTNDNNPVLQISSFEEKLLVRKYSPLDRKPADDNTETTNTGKDNQQGFVPVEGADLF